MKCTTTPTPNPASNYTRGALQALFIATNRHNKKIDLARPNPQSALRTRHPRHRTSRFARHINTPMYDYCCTCTCNSFQYDRDLTTVLAAKRDQVYLIHEWTYTFMYIYMYYPDQLWALLTYMQTLPRSVLAACKK